MERASIQEAWTGPSDCRNCAIRHLVLFSQLDARDFDLLHRPIEDVALDPGEPLYSQGQPSGALYTVRSGLLKLVQYASDGTQRIVRLLRSGDVAGLEALLGQPYNHDAVALQRVALCRLPADLIQQLDRSSPRLHAELLRRWQQALADADLWLTQLSTGSARVRVARLLLRAADLNGNACNLLTREDMGAVLGITMETASRTIAAFRREGLITEGKNQVLHCQLERLRAIAG